MSIRTVLFDLDGTLINTNELIYASFAYTFKQFNLTFTNEELKSFNGPPLIDTFNKVNPEQAEAMFDTYREHNFTHHDEYVEVYPHVLETIKRLKEANIPLGIVTTKMRDGAMKGLDLMELTPYFDTIITLNEVTHAKPHPEPVLKAMKNLHAKPASTLMIGDNYHDIKAGKRAGVKTAGVVWADKGREYLESYQPNYMIEDMRDLLHMI